MPARLVGPLAERAHHDFTVHMAAHVMTGMRELRGDRLEDWMRSVEPDDLPALHSFLTGIRRDQDAVVAGLTLSWSSGAVEGAVTRIKLLKRIGYGRAKLDLLRKRILHAT